MSRTEQAKQLVKKNKDLVIKISNELLQKLGLGFWIFVGMTFFMGFLFFFKLNEIVRVATGDYGYVGIFLVSFISDFLVQPVGPDLPLIAGVLSPRMQPLLVFLLVLAGSYTALFFAYYVGKIIGTRGIERIVGAHTYATIMRNPSVGRWTLFLGALTPIPYVPYLAGLWELSFRDVILYVVLPRSLRFFIILVLTYYLGPGILSYFPG